MIATSIEQSKKLLDLGIDPKTADMFYRDNGIDLKLRWELLNDEANNPAWSLSALLDIIKEQDGLSTLTFLPSTYDGRGNRLINVWRLLFETIDILKDVYGENPIDVAVEMIEWLCKIGYMRKEDEE